MPIKGLTNQQPQFPQIGQLRKGIWDEEAKRARDLDYFRFTSDIPEVMDAFFEAYGDQPRLINVYLPHKTTDENWEGWMEEYVASGLIHRCDGEYVVRYRDRQTGGYVDPPPGTVKCPYESGERERTQEHPGCKPQGRLQVVIRELKRFAYVMVLTTSWNDIKHLDAQLRALEQIHGDLRGIPLQLRRQPERISTPQMKKQDGQWVRTAERARRESWLLSIEAAPEWADMRMEAQRIEALPTIPKQLEAHTDDSGVDIEQIDTGTWRVVRSADSHYQEGDTISLVGLDGEDIHGPAIDEPEEEREEEQQAVEDDHKDGSTDHKKGMTLGSALGTALNAAAPGYGLPKGSYLLEAVKKDARDLIEYLAKTSNYKDASFENVQCQQAAQIILDNWDAARQVVLKEKVTESRVDAGEGGTPPLF